MTLKLAALSFVFMALHLWLQGVLLLHVAADMTASLTLTLWLFPTVTAFVEVLITLRSKRGLGLT